MSKRTRNILALCEEKKASYVSEVSRNDLDRDKNEKTQDINKWLSNIDIQYLRPLEESKDIVNKKINILSNIVISQNHEINQIQTDQTCSNEEFSNEYEPVKQTVQSEEPLYYDLSNIVVQSSLVPEKFLGYAKNKEFNKNEQVENISTSNSIVSPSVDDSIDDPLYFPSDSENSQNSLIVHKSNDPPDDILGYEPQPIFYSDFQMKGIENYLKEKAPNNRGSFVSILFDILRNNQLNNSLVGLTPLDINDELSRTENNSIGAKTCDLVSKVNDNFTEGVSKPESSLDTNILEGTLETDEVKHIESTRKKHYADKLNYCFYCDKDVSHFVRHITTWHPNEITVQKILSLPPNSKTRRNLVSSLRKKGNFVKNRANDTLRPVKRLNPRDSSEMKDFLPCSYCLGYYKRKSLYRHTKKCPENLENREKRQTAQSDGQNTLLLGQMLKYDKLLSKELFSHMRADKLNLTAKQDELICQYAYSYMKGRKSKGNLDFVRQNVRRLARLLEFSRQQNSEIKHLIDILKPTYFSLIIKGVNHIARYNPETDIYESPTLAMNFGTLLKKCCDLAYIHYIQIENTSDQRKDLKILQKLIESQWADEISAQAGLNLNEKKWNKSELLPLTTDLKKLSVFLESSAQKAFEDLQLNGHNQIAYNTLKEVLYTQIIILNRRRPAEVAQLNIDKYNAINLVNNENGNTEFEKCLTETEKILINSFSRIVIRGKRGRGVPILLSPDMKKHFDYLISIRSKYNTTGNKYIFHTTGQGCIDGTKTLYKYALKSGIEHPRSISATRLRKHLATITQLLQFGEKDLEQLSAFRGHTLNTHCKVYRLSDNLYQTAKVSKLLLLMSTGGIEQYKGKQLDEIDIDLSPEIEEEDLESRITNQEEDMNELEGETKKEMEELSFKKNIARTRKPTIRCRWTTREKQIIAKYFSGHIKNKIAPKQKEVEELITRYPKEFKNKKWTSIKAVVYNMYTGKLVIY